MVTPAAPDFVPEKLAGWTLQRPPEGVPEDHVGQFFAGRYMLLRKIGGGGMSTIYMARDATLGKSVVVKIMRADLPSDPVDRFRREAVVLAKLSHEHIGGILDRQDPEEGPRFLVAEYIDGLDLSHLRRRGPMPAAVAVQIGLHVSAALAYAHTHGVIHRDVKPSNVMLVRHPGGDVFAKVIDFGIAKLARGSDLADDAPAGARRETRGDAVAGTAPYWCGQEGPRRDVYALALTLSELLTGEDPNPEADLTRMQIPPGLADVMTRALRGAIGTMDMLHGALREADVQPPAEAEAERRRYISQVFQTASASEPATDGAARFAGRYIVCDELGEGGMGRVRAAFDTVNRRRVALKTIQARRAGITNLEHRFRREGWALAAIDHPGTPILFESGATPEPFFTMEIVEGVTLATILQAGRLPPLRALGVAIDLAAILRAGHEVGVIHRDVKPDNIVLGQGDRVRLLDFGACLLMPRFFQRHLMFPATPPELRYATGELEHVGTPGYSAPEVMTSGGTGPRSDIYSVCVVLYEMLTGRRYESPTVGRARPIDPGEFSAALGPVADVLRRGTAREPSERPWSMADLERSFEILRAGAVHAQRRRQLWVVALLAVVATGAIVSLAFQILIGTNGTTAVVVESVAPPSIAPPTTTLPVSLAPAPAGGPAVPAVPPDHLGPKPPDDTKTGVREKTVNNIAMLTMSMVRARLMRRHSRLEKCGAPLLTLDLTIDRGQPVLGTVNGMADGDPTHDCVRDELRGLVFPFAGMPQEFTVTLDLDSKVK